MQAKTLGVICTEVHQGRRIVSPPFIVLFRLPWADQRRFPSSKRTAETQPLSPLQTCRGPSPSLYVTQVSRDTHCSGPGRLRRQMQPAVSPLSRGQRVSAINASADSDIPERLRLQLSVNVRGGDDVGKTHVSPVCATRSEVRPQPDYYFLKMRYNTNLLSQ